LIPTDIPGRPFLGGSFVAGRGLAGIVEPIIVAFPDLPSRPCCLALFMTKSTTCYCFKPATDYCENPPQSLITETSSLSFRNL
jgi:hypothetical protein